MTKVRTFLTITEFHIQSIVLTKGQGQTENNV